MKKDYLIGLVTFISGAIISTFMNQSKTVFWVICGIVILCTLIIVFFQQILNFFRCLLPLCTRNIFKKRTSTKGVFGRDKLVTEILQWHNSNRFNKVAIISGAAGAGKTTLARALKDSVLSPSSVIVVTKSDSFYKDYKNLNEYKSNCIIIFDYVLESFEKIREYINELMRPDADGREKNRKISIILLERDVATSSIMWSIGVKEDKIRHLDLDQYKLDNHTLTEIVKYKVQCEDDDKAVKRKITDEDARLITQKISNQLDKNHCRPIFASVLATIYRRSESFDYDLDTKDAAFAGYWDVVTGFRKFLPDHLASDEGIHNYVNNLKCNVKIISVFATITVLDILCYSEGNSFQIEFRDSNSGSKVIMNPSLCNLVKNAFCTSGAPSKNLITWLRYLYQHNSTPSQDPIGIIIHPMMLDIFSSWMLSKAIGENQELLSHWFTMISKTDKGKYYNRTYSFIIRAAEDFGYAVFEWFMDINLPDDVSETQWENIFSTDIDYILDMKSESILSDKFLFFEKHYNRLLVVVEDPEKFKRITQNIISMVDDKGENRHSAKGFKQLQDWCEQQKQTLNKGGRKLI